ncbi:HipA domain-containing protein [Aeromonas caviae]|uniref:HipA domain-containing protein n=1 Tax=Aeromonas TaxID=642 RepID=UPI0013150665|nr:MULTISPECIES: HipA domain-containing protein [Aeromonas]MBP4060846.1 hypothetical protein [Aeromonas sp. Prich7-2]MCR3905145.1 HipA domain-containing protein [Aeromonas hydrophila]WKL88774.1 HipA domain-containing protein [Aeromonas caviae]WOX52453.1 HipA domain-containing protein [Aeromonas sp. CD]
MFRIYDISAFDKVNIEELGTKSKFWYTDESGGEFLFKSVVTYDRDGHEIKRYGEDWAEKVACELAKAIDIPCADYELAIYNGERGVLTPNIVVDKTLSLSLGNEILKKYNDQQSLVTEEKQNIFLVYLIMRRLIRNKPLKFNSQTGIKSAADFFCGYLMLDALISNQDRHSENWGFLTTKNGTYHLSPTFDHAASLGRNESIEKKSQRLMSKDRGQKVETYVKKSKSYFYLKDNRLKTLSAFEFFGILTPNAALKWVEKIKNYPCERFDEILNLIPKEVLDDVSKQFASKMFKCNRDNIISLEKTFVKCLNPAVRKELMRTYE